MSPPSRSSDIEAQVKKLDPPPLPRHVTIDEHEEHHPSSPTVPSPDETAPRLTAEFRTLSIHVQTHTSPIDGDATSRKAEIKGAQGSHPMSFMGLCISPQNCLRLTGIPSP